MVFCTVHPPPLVVMRNTVSNRRGFSRKTVPSFFIDTLWQKSIQNTINICTKNSFLKTYNNATTKLQLWYMAHSLRLCVSHLFGLHLYFLKQYNYGCNSFKGGVRVCQMVYAVWRITIYGSLWKLPRLACMLRRLWYLSRGSISYFITTYKR